MKGLVLSGGGAKGAYEVGVIKALEKLGYDFDIVTGTSIGSVNAMLYVEGGYKLMHKFWTNCKVKDLFDIENINELAEENYDRARMKVTMEAFLRGGLETNAFFNKVKKVINEDKLRKSKKKIGIMTFNVTTMKGEEIYFDDLEEGKFAEYILASSSCFPILKGTKIDDSFYIDGGFSDNMPIEMALKMGARDIVSVDLKAPGVKKIIGDKYKGEEINLKVISSNKDLGDMIVFTKKEIEENINLGYLDCMKTFNKAYGKDLIISDKLLNKMLEKCERIKLEKELSSLEKEIKDNPLHFTLDSLDLIYDHIKENKKYVKKYSNKILNIFNMKKLIYFNYFYKKKNIDDMFKKIKDIKGINDLKEINNEDINNFSEELKTLGKNYKSLITKYIYNLLYVNKNDKDRVNKLKMISIFLRREMKLAIFIHELMK